MQNILLVPREVAPAASPDPALSRTASRGLAVVPTVPAGRYRVEWLGREIGALVPARHPRRPPDRETGNGASTEVPRPLPLDDAAAALLGAWLLAHRR